MPAGAAEVCSAWSEPARIAVQVQLRNVHRMRADPSWALEVARSPRARFGYGGILMSPEELQDFQARFTRLADAEGRRAPMIQQAMAYANQQSASFAGCYLRRTSDYFFDPPAALVLMFVGDLAVHESALASLPRAEIALEIVPARFSMQQQVRAGVCRDAPSIAAARIRSTVPATA